MGGRIVNILTDYHLATLFPRRTRLGKDRLHRFAANQSSTTPGQTSNKTTRRQAIKGVILGAISLLAVFTTNVAQGLPPKTSASGTQTLTPAEKTELTTILKDAKVKTKAWQMFEDALHEPTGLVLDRIPNRAAKPAGYRESGMASIAATGYGLALNVIKAENGFFGKDKQAAKNKVVQRLNKALDTAEKLGRPEYGRFLPHFIEVKTQKNLAEISTVDTMLFYLGALAAGQYCGGKSLARVESMFNKLDFEKMRTRNGHPSHAASSNISHGIRDGYFIPYHWGGPYSEGVHLVNLMALASDKVPLSVWTHGWSRQKNWRLGNRQTFTATPLFTYFYPLGYLPLKGKQDSQGEHYWKAAQNAVLMQGDYCRQRQYPHNLFGLTACDAPPPIGYKAYHPGNDDGTIAPPAIIASIPLAEKQSLEALRALKRLNLLQSHYGPVNAYNVFTGWRAPDALSIDVGSMALMLDAYEGGTLLKLMGQNRIVRKAMQRAGFKPVSAHN